MRHSIRVGVISKEVCGEWILLATGEAQKVCPLARQLNSTGAFFWKMLEQGLDDETMISKALDQFDMDELGVRHGFSDFIRVLEEQRFLLTQEETKELFPERCSQSEQE